MRTMMVMMMVAFVLGMGMAADAATLYPGYGYAEPGYAYRLGQEVERTFLHAFWRHEKRTFEAEKEMTLQYTLEYSAQANIDLEVLEIIKVAKIEIGGKFVTVFTARVKTKETFETECTVKYEKTKVWYALQRAKKEWFSTGTWSTCGRTYEIIQEATGEEVLDAPGRVEIADNPFSAETLRLAADWAARSGSPEVMEGLGGLSELHQQQAFTMLDNGNFDAADAQRLDELQQLEENL